MTEQEFLKEIEKLNCSWIKIIPVDNDITRPVHIRTMQYGEMRCCPITALYYARTKKLLPLASWASAAAVLDIDFNLARQIIAAADNDKKYSFFKPSLRKKLLKVCKLERGKR